MNIDDPSQLRQQRASEPVFDHIRAGILAAQHQSDHRCTPAPHDRDEQPLMAQFREAAAFNVSHPGNSQYGPHDLSATQSILTATRRDNLARMDQFASEHYRQGQIQSLITFCDGLSTSLKSLHRHAEQRQPHQQQVAKVDELIELQLFIALIYPKLLSLQEWMDVPRFPTPHD